MSALPDKLLYEVKIPMKVFSTEGAAQDYYNSFFDAYGYDPMELVLYTFHEGIEVYSFPTPDSFNPSFFSGDNFLLADYVPESPIDYTVSATANYSTYGYVTGAGTYPEHTTATLNAYAYTGYAFNKWSNDVETSTYSFTVENNVNLTAIFEEATVAEPTIEFAVYYIEADDIYELAAKMACETEGATIKFAVIEEGTEPEYYDYYEDLENPDYSVEIDGEKYLILGDNVETTISMYAELAGVTSDTVTETYTPEPEPTTTQPPSTVADPVITIVEAELPNGSTRLCCNITCETEGATIMYSLDEEHYNDYAEAIEQAEHVEGATIEIDGETYLVYTRYTTELTVYAYAELDEDTSNTVSETYTKYIFGAYVNGEGGLISKDGGEPAGGIDAEFVPGENTFEFEAIPNTGYEFVNWTDANNEEITTDNPYEVTPTETATIYANFEATTANISISSVPLIGGSVDGAGSTIIGESYTVMAEANTGYEFVNWTENGTEVSTSANYTFTVAGDRTLVANFEATATTEPPAGVADPVLTYFLNPVEGEDYVKLCVNATCETVGATTYLTVSSNGTDMGPFDFELWKQMGTVEKDGVVYVKTVNLGSGDDMSTTATISSYAQLNEDTSNTVTATAVYE